MGITIRALYLVFRPRVKAVVRKAGLLYNQGKYQRILKRWKRLAEPEDKFVVYRNLIRVMCLQKVGDQVWKKEYGIVLNSGQLDLLGTQTAKYFEQYIYGSVFGLQNASFDDIQMDIVSELMKEVFPLDNLYNLYAEEECIYVKSEFRDDDFSLDIFSSRAFQSPFFNANKD